LSKVVPKFPRSTPKGPPRDPKGAPKDAPGTPRDSVAPTDEFRVPYHLDITPKSVPKTDPKTATQIAPRGVPWDVLRVSPRGGGGGSRVELPGGSPGGYPLATPCGFPGGSPLGFSKYPNSEIPTIRGNLIHIIPVPKHRPKGPPTTPQKSRLYFPQNRRNHIQSSSGEGISLKMV
jgi:hypothetical protein